MNQLTVYKKSVKGEEEISTRNDGLSRDLRSTLICVDGKSSVAKIIDASQGLMNVPQCLEELVEKGHVVVDEKATIETMKSELIVAAHQILGADAEKITGKIRCTHETRESLDAAVHSCKKLVRLVIDEKKAEALMSKCSEILTP
jgi:ribosome-binding ATPase YchF (GTP1/OBG family)